MKPDLYSDKLQVCLATFVRKMQLLDKADNPKLVARIVVNWTQEQALLTKKLLQYVIESNSRIKEGEEANAVEKVIRNRLLREFKKDDLTLRIRKNIYQKDLENILEINSGKLDDKDRIFLLKSKNNLGLTDKQVSAINKKKIASNRYFSFNSNNHLLDNKSALDRMTISQGIRSLSLETPGLCEQSDLITQSFTTPKIEAQTKKPFNKKWFWLLLWTPFLFLTVKGFDWGIKYPLFANNNSELEQKKLCVDLASRKSPRMSLGEKLLTKEYSQLNPAGINASYEGMAAFARCEFSAAESKYQQSIDLDKNNPEALIYRNNAKAIAEQHFKIAVSIPLGSKPDIAWEILRGVAQAQSEVNQEGGINDRLLLVQVVNDDNDPHIVEQLAKQLAADENVLAVVGHNDSNSSIAGAKIYEANKLVMISPTSTSTKLSGIGSYIMRTIPSVSALADKLANYASGKSLTSIAICSDSQDSASGSFSQEFILQTTKSGGQIVPINCDFAQQDFQPDSIVDRAVAQNVDALLLAPSVNKMNQAIAVAQANQQKLPLLGNHSLYTYKTIESGQNAIAGIVIPSPWLSDNVHRSNFPEAAIQYWGGEVNWRTAMAYDAVMAISQGLEQSSSRHELQAVLTQANFSVDGATGSFQFEQGDRSGQIQLVYIEKSFAGDNYEFLRLKL